MVLNKRKPVHFVPNPTDLSDNAEVYVMKGTNEVFTDYEKYLKRFDWLNQKKFTDAVNGKSGLTFWDALESENKSSASIENVFPEVLRDPILRKVQFSTISRMDELVNTIYDEFKHDFFPGEEVFISHFEGEQLSGVIREKAKFPMIRAADGTVQRAPFSRYFVRLYDRSDEALMDDKLIRRDRKVFTKQNLRSFLKNSLQREAWNGAPWLVKEHLAMQYRLPMEIPTHLLQDARLLINKTDPSSQQLMQVRTSKGKKTKNPMQDEISHLHEDGHMQQISSTLPLQPHPNHQNIASRTEQKTQLPPTIKYPIEDLDVAPKRNGVTRPELNFFTEEMADFVKGNRQTMFTDIDMNSMGMLLEVWNTLNVQCEVYVLDSFTFDDFVDAMRYSSTEVTCELFEEIHCAVLKLFVDDKGKVQVKDLPQKVEDSPEDESDAMDESIDSTPIPDVPARSTRSRLSQMSLVASIPDTSNATLERPHRASEMMGEKDWASRIAAQDFENGGWQVIVVGLLHQLSASPAFKTQCDKILSHLAPAELDPSRDTALEQYATMNINLRISALQMLTILTIRTDAIKTFLETCSEDMTDVRKRKIEHQREKKFATEELTIKDRERRIQLPNNMPESPKPDITESDIMDVTMETNGTADSDADEDAPPTGRSLRRGMDRKRKREEEAARREKERAERAEAAKAHSKQTKEFRKLLHDIEELKKKILQNEEKIAECDSDLREANVQRTKVLGKDRFCNRYYWFERNGQPFGGLPRSSTASYGYANGRIWVQGPDAMEKEGFIDRSIQEQKLYQEQFHMTVPERRHQEEGATILMNAEEWGFYDDPHRLDNLIGWLDDRGDRERKLRKELMEWRDLIVQYMEAHRKFKDEEAAKKVEAEEEPSNRITTRHKIYVDHSATRDRCLKWTNTMAMDENGHLHSHPPKPKEKKQKREGKGVAVPLNRQGKPVTRQGEKYSFK